MGDGERLSRVIQKDSSCLAPPTKMASSEGQIIRRRSSGLGRPLIKGDPDAEVSLGEMYQDGEFVSQNYLLAAKWDPKAKEHSPDMGGAGQGRNQLGMLYEDGLGVPKSLVLAYMWYSLTEFQENLKEVECDMTRAQIAKARKMAVDWLKAHPVGTRYGGAAG